MANGNMAINWLALLLLFIPDLAAAEPEKLWQAANTQFQNAKTSEEYNLAAASFETLVKLGVRNGYLFYNLGNAYLKANRLGEAIANYRRATLYIPDYSDLEENLRYARSLRQATFAVSESSQTMRYILFWHFWSWRIRFYLFLFCYSSLWLILLLRLRYTTFPFWPLFLMVILPVLACGISLIYESRLSATRLEAVLVGGDTQVRKGNGDNYETLYAENKAMAGVEVQLLETQGQWCKVELPDRLCGWVKQDKVVAIVQ
jgi:tetratricopeptide (TPR) repeat protein